MVIQAVPPGPEAQLLAALTQGLGVLDILQPTPYQSRWEQWFGDYPEISALKALLVDKPLTRPFIKSLAETANKHEGELDPLRLLFVATMMWGWGKAPRARVFVRAAMCDAIVSSTTCCSTFKRSCSPALYHRLILPQKS